MYHVAARMASPDEYAGRYQRHRPEQTLLYQMVDEYYPVFAGLMAAFPFSCAFCSPASQRSWGRCSASFIACLPRT